jgi:hypothetical protein
LGHRHLDLSRYAACNYLTAGGGELLLGVMEDAFV